MLTSRARIVAAVVLSAVLLAPFSPAAAQPAAAQPVPAAGQPSPPDHVHGLSVVPEIKALKYRSIGPAQGGRVTHVAGIAGDPNTYYVATASGGIWKSSDGGLTFKAIFDDQATSSIGSIAI